MSGNAPRPAGGTTKRAVLSRTSQWILVDAVLWAATLIGALWLRYDFSADQLINGLGKPRFYLLLLSLIALTSMLGWLAGLYRGRYVPGSVLESSILTLVLALSTGLVSIGHIIAAEIDGVPRSTPLIAGAFTILSALVLRSLVRRKRLFGAGSPIGAERALLFGAGDGGLQLVRQLRRSPNAQFNPVAILDDDPTKLHMLIEGVRVFGGREKIAEVAERTGSSTLLLAVPSLSGEELIDIRDRAEQAGLHVLVLPSLESMMRGRVAVDELREINVNDLLGRKAAQLNLTQIAEYVRGKRILVTGAGGSIGSELCRQLTRLRPAELMMLDRDESGLHSVQLSIHDQAMLDGDDTILASIRDRDSLRTVLQTRRPHIVFHAAALKHMPLLETYPLEALKTNVLGTQNLLAISAEAGVETFVNISTDKAANPSSVLGFSKRIAERITAQRAILDSKGKYVSVRFGNVLGSRGSVLTVFENQIQNGGPVTVTDPEVTRFFMTIPEACQLVLQAAVLGASGETLVLDMGEPVKIANVAKTLIEQSGKPIEVVYTGLRGAEKLHEELFDDTEVDTAHRKHPSITEVRVPPLTIDADAVNRLSTHSEARLWLERQAYVTD